MEPLKTKNLILSEITPNDRMALFKIATNINKKADFDSGYYPYYGFQISSDETVSQKVMNFIKKNEASKAENPMNTHRYGIRKDGKLIGAVIIDMIPCEENGKTIYGDIGYFMDPEYGRQGLMKEAVTKVLIGFFEKFDRLDITAHPNNIPSNRLIKSLGGVPTELKETSCYNGEPRQAFVVTKDSFKKTLKQLKISDVILKNDGREHD